MIVCVSEWKSLVSTLKWFVHGEKVNACGFNCQGRKGGNGACETAVSSGASGLRELLVCGGASVF